MGTIIAFPENCILTEGQGPKNKLIASLSKHGSDIRTLEHDEDIKIPEFSFLDNWSAEKQPTTNWYKFNSNDRASEPLALHADANLSDPKNAGRYSIHNHRQSTGIITKTAQHIMCISTAYQNQLRIFQVCHTRFGLSITFFA
jgi:hypothetical protein